ncbi:TonB-dependent receptor [Myroides sp. LJL119]
MLVTSLMLFGVCFGQSPSISGVIKDLNNQALEGATITMGHQTTWSDQNGNYQLKNLNKQADSLYVSYFGYKNQVIFTDLTKSLVYDFILDLEDYALDQIVISKSPTGHGVTNSQVISANKIQQNYQGSLAKSLSNQAGVNSMDIGAGGSKPVIRGLGFNRLVVAQNGTKQEGQQWGADHALEIDAFSSEKITIIKGVGTIEYGSDAIAGVIKVDNEQIPQENSFSGDLRVLTQSVNDSYGAALGLKARKDKFFYKFNSSYIDYADYRVPTNSINYLNTKIPIYNNRMKNTAGRNWTVSAQVGYLSDKWTNILTVSNFYDKSGFFPGSHGMPDITAVVPDNSPRNIDLPNQSVNHFKAVNNTTYQINNYSKIKFSNSFQNNFRQEKSKFHSHYPTSITQLKDPNLELEFNLSTWDSSLLWENLSKENHLSKVGVSYNYQNNAIGGYGFLLPKYHRSGWGVFMSHEHQVNQNFVVELGLRVDMANLDMDGYFDQDLYGYLLKQGHSESFALEYANRASSLNRNFKSFNWLVGAKYNLSQTINFGATIGSNFRFPTAIELGSNGIHHGAFRFERGTPTLDPEKGISFDFRAELNTSKFVAVFSPYLYYFSNYIFLKPTGKFSVLPDSGQIYQYDQTRAILNGFELSLDWNIIKQLSFMTVLEYTYTQQVHKDKSANYPLPFSAPLNLYLELEYGLKDTKYFKNSAIQVNTKWFAKQNRIAQGEDVTAASLSFGASLTSDIFISKTLVKATLQATNIFNRKNLNHMSFYRALEIPDPGRNIQLNIQIPF